MIREETQVKINELTQLIMRWEGLLASHPAWSASCASPPPRELVQQMLNNAYYLIILYTFRQWVVASIFENMVAAMSNVLYRHHLIISNMFPMEEEMKKMQMLITSSADRVKEMETEDSEYQKFQKAFQEVKEAGVVDIIDALEKKGLPSIRQMEGIETVDDFLKQIM